MLGTGLLVYLLSKEIYVINHETFAAACIGAIIVYGVKKFGPSVAAYADKLNEVGLNCPTMITHGVYLCARSGLSCVCCLLLDIPFAPQSALLSCVQICKRLDLYLQEKLAKANEVKDSAISSLTQAIADEKKEQWRVDGRAVLFDAKRVSSNTFVYILVVT